MFNHPAIQEIDSGSYEISLNGTNAGFAWFTIDTFGNRTAYFALPGGTTFPFVLSLSQSLTFTRIKEDFKSPGEFGKWGDAQLGGSADFHCMIETLIAWNGA
ncbi:hypothetical protein DV096_10310 [Bradymonadaceae bacterium TMQ3]|uniref:Uncharacterized protein n=1 Tax=Lujinxingia sediminis TaxID=2480984 RepID=A0ABY0CSH3_9DELT|nr:hypothetical protein [Lujinxingia sediminis]RDV38197.1 hypothetical protein DV096_10310 [Bradymonadaceae bacterium TMQ3]RVU43604.1 hypothetical protein EA187_12315 [Lujinxingia sediminis]TXC75867.1 hypothetical protein FRC91_10215 [Bradymonadales bacterium TMQ1]